MCCGIYNDGGLCTVGVVDDEIMMMVSGVGLEQKKWGNGLVRLVDTRFFFWDGMIITCNNSFLYS